MGIDFPSRLSASAGQKFTYSGQEYEFNGTAWKKVRDKVTSFNGATGAIVGVTSVQGKTGDVTLTDLEITHGVETFNGLSGSIDTTSLTLPVAGISASSGITVGSNMTIENLSIKNDSNIDLHIAGEHVARFRHTGIVLNQEGSASNNLFVKGDNDSFLISTDATNDRVGIGTGSPTEKFEVDGTIKASGITLGAGGITFADGTFQDTAARALRVPVNFLCRLTKPVLLIR